MIGERKLRTIEERKLRMIGERKLRTIEERKLRMIGERLQDQNCFSKDINKRKTVTTPNETVLDSCLGKNFYAGYLENQRY
jgi:hypothetical protein